MHIIYDQLFKVKDLKIMALCFNVVYFKNKRIAKFILRKKKNFALRWDGVTMGSWLNFAPVNHCDDLFHSSAGGLC